MTSPAERRLSDALRDLVSTQPFEPDPAAIERRGRRLLRRFQTTRVVGAGVVVAVAAATVAATVHPGVTTGQAIATPGAHPATSTPAKAQPLVQLADDIQAMPKPVGDATLVVRNRVLNGRPILGFDLYGDNGTYYYADTRADLPSQVRGHDDVGQGSFGREVAAAEYAATGDLEQARVRMANAALDPSIAAQHPITEKSKLRDGGPQIDNYIWENSQDAMTAGAGNPVVRAGVLRLLSTLTDVAVTHTSTDGQATLTLTATAPAMPPGYQEVLSVAADNGFPVAFAGGDVGQQPQVTIQFQVTRVTLADVASGKF